MIHDEPPLQRLFLFRMLLAIWSTVSYCRLIQKYTLFFFILALMPYS